MVCRRHAAGVSLVSLFRAIASYDADSWETLKPTAQSLKPRAYLLNKSPIACFMTCPPTSAMDLVSGMSFGQISTQFWA